jgi:hypothetical protein
MLSLGAGTAGAVAALKNVVFIAIIAGVVNQKYGFSDNYFTTVRFSALLNPVGTASILDNIRV